MSFQGYLPHKTITNERQADLSQCSKCNARIFWSVNIENSRRHPVNAVPVDTGNIALLVGNTFRILRNEVLVSVKRLGGTALYESHNASCPFANDFRRK